MDYTNLPTVLIWLTGAGGPYLAGRLAALLAENWQKWHTLPRPLKVVLPMGVSVLIAALATLLLRNQAFVAQASPWFTLLMGAMLSYLGTQEGYMAARKANYGRSVRGNDGLITISLERGEEGTSDLGPG